MANTTEARKYVSPDEAEGISSISSWTWRRKASSGEIESSKVGGRLLLPLDEIERVIKEGTRPRMAEEIR